MNSCHLAQCEMMGHSCATRRAGTEFAITRTNSPSSPSPPSTPSPPPPPPPPYCTCLDLLNMDGGMGSGERERTFLSLRLLLSPVPHLRRCGTRINGIQQHGEIAAGSVCLSVCVQTTCVQQVRLRIQSFENLNRSTCTYTHSQRMVSD